MTARRIQKQGISSLAAMIMTGTAWIRVAIRFALGLSGPRRAWAGFRWLAGGLLLQLGVVLIMDFAGYRVWPHGQQQVVGILGMLAAVVMLACLSQAMRIRAKSRT